MATVALAWEIGRGGGYAERLLALAGALRRAGHAPVLALREPERAAGQGFAVFPAPWAGPLPLPAGRTSFVPASLACVWGRQGWADAGVLAELVTAWVDLLARQRPALLVAEHAPAAALAARAMALPVLHLGTGFALPPAPPGSRALPPYPGPSTPPAWPPGSIEANALDALRALEASGRAPGAPRAAAEIREGGLAGWLRGQTRLVHGPSLLDPYRSTRPVDPLERLVGAFLPWGGESSLSSAAASVEASSGSRTATPARPRGRQREPERLGGVALPPPRPVATPPSPPPSGSPPVFDRRSREGYGFGDGRHLLQPVASGAPSALPPDRGEPRPRASRPDAPPKRHLLHAYLDATAPNFPFVARSLLRLGKVAGVGGTLLIPAIGDAQRAALEGAGFEVRRSGVPLAPALRALKAGGGRTLHHGGIETTAAALLSGVPQFLVPRNAAQKAHARPLLEAGIAHGLSPVTCRDELLELLAGWLDEPGWHDRAERAAAAARAAEPKRPGVEAAAEAAAAMLEG